MPQSKDKGWLNGYKNKTPIYAVYKRPTSQQWDTYRLKVKGYVDFFIFYLFIFGRAMWRMGA